MIPFRQIAPERLRPIRAVLTDIDDTLTTEGRLGDEAYAALWDLHRAGIAVIPVTGRPAGWCDLIARQWPVAAVVGENGGFYFHHDGRRMQRRYLHAEAVRAGFRERLGEVGRRILAEVPGTAIAADQPWREYDLAIDFCEDVAPLGTETARRIEAIFRNEGAHARISSIHVNGWFGEFDKLSTARLALGELLGLDPAAEPDAALFCGDSPNDEPMFAAFPLAVGVANLSRFAGMLRRPPAFIAERAAGAGFREIADAILKARGAIVRAEAC